MADERESLLWGFVNTFDAQVRQTRPQRRPPQPRAARPSDQPGRHRNQVPRARAGHRPRAEPRRPARRLREDARRSGRRLPHLRPATPGDRDAAPTSRRPDTSPPQPSTHATSCAHARTARPGRTCPRERWSPSQAGSRSPTSQRRHRPPRQGEGEVRRHHPRARRRPRRRAHRGAVGRAERRPPGGVQAGLERTRTGRSVPAQRRAAQPPPQGRHRLPRLRHHRQPGRQGREARHPGATGGRIARTASKGRVASAAWPFLFGRRPEHNRDRLRVARRLRRRATRRLRRSSSASPRAVPESATTTRVLSSPCRNARPQWHARQLLSLASAMLPPMSDAGAGEGATAMLQLMVPMLTVTHTPMLVMMPMVLVLNTDTSLRMFVRQGFARSLRDRAFRCQSPLRGLDPFRLQSLSPPVASLPARSACPTARCAPRRVPDRHGRGHIRRHRQRHRRVLLATALRSPWPAAPAAGFASARRRRTPCVAGAGFAVHRAAHCAVQSCPHKCGHFLRHFRPLKRRGGCALPGSPVSISPTLMQQVWPFRTARGGLGSHTRRISDAGCGIDDHVRDMLRLTMNRAHGSAFLTCRN